MILVWAVIIGLLLSLLRYRGELFNRLASIPINHAWLILIAIGMQLPLLRAAAVPAGDLFFQQVLFILSHVVLLIFVWLNRHITGILVIGSGVVLNLAVILFNDGFMPISPETLVRINPGTISTDWLPDSHYAYSKDVILAKEETNLWWLSDFLVLPIPLPVRAAFSPGDLIIAAGIIFLLFEIPTTEILLDQEVSQSQTGE